MYYCPPYFSLLTYASAGSILGNLKFFKMSSYVGGSLELCVSFLNYLNTCLFTLLIFILIIRMNSVIH